MPSEREDEIGAGHRQHLPVVCVGRHVADLGRTLGGETGIGVLDGDQLHVRHGDEMTEVSGVENRMPVADLDRGNANGHGYPRGRASSLRKPTILTSVAVRREGGSSENWLRYFLMI